MRRWLAPALGAAMLAAAIGCAAAEPTPSPTATPTLSVVREWDVDGVSVDGSVVTVLLHVFAGVDVWVTLDGEPAGDVAFAPPALRSVFHEVAPGAHVVEVRDIVGFTETAVVDVAAPSIPGS